MRAGQALVICRCRQVHTIGMRFPIDVLFIDRNGAVVRVCRGLRPGRISPIAWRATAAVELPAGSAELSATADGDVIEIRDSADLDRFAAGDP
jgi:uncharacterized membrane protein (UPF0127 family)